MTGKPMSEAGAQRELTPQELRLLGPSRMLVQVRAISYQGENINCYEVADPAGKELPPFSAGSHIDLYFRDQRVRQYSLCSSPLDRSRYQFAVQREAQGRGGSRAIFERVHVGRILTISEPRNSFPLRAEATRHLFLAGGIGITPFMSMIHYLHSQGGQFALHYCTRSPDKTAFLEQLKPLQAQGRAHIYHDGGDPSRGLDIPSLLRVYEPGTHLYYCGPKGFMAAVEAAAAHWPREAVHFEYFSPPAAQGSPAGMAAAVDHGGFSSGELEGTIGVGFQVKVSSSGQIFDIPNDKSIVQVLREHGIAVQTSCESGLCGTCRTRYLEGVPEHRDYILDEAERGQEVLICCARSRTRLLVLDL